MNCLFHQKPDCLCITSVATEKDLIVRLASDVRRLELQAAHEPDADVKAKMLAEAGGYRERLKEISNV